MGVAQCSQVEGAAPSQAARRSAGGRASTRLAEATAVVSVRARQRAAAVERARPPITGHAGHPSLTHRKAQEQVGDGGPEVAGADPLALVLVEALVLDVPLLKVRARARATRRATREEAGEVDVVCTHMCWKW